MGSDAMVHISISELSAMRAKVIGGSLNAYSGEGQWRRSSRFRNGRSRHRAPRGEAVPLSRGCHLLAQRSLGVTLFKGGNGHLEIVAPLDQRPRQYRIFDVGSVGNPGALLFGCDFGFDQLNGANKISQTSCRLLRPLAERFRVLSQNERVCPFVSSLWPGSAHYVHGCRTADTPFASCLPIATRKNTVTGTHPPGPSASRRLHRKGTCTDSFSPVPPEKRWGFDSATSIEK